MAALAAGWALIVALPPGNGGITDLVLYARTGDAVAGGSVPYRDFFFEYPPLAAPLFAAPQALWDYREGFAAVMLVFGWVLQVAVGGGWRAWVLVALPLVFGTLLTERFDLAPAALTLAGVVALERGRTRTGFAVLGLGVALKGFPIVVAAVAVAWLAGRGRNREALAGGALCIVVAGVCWLPFVIVAPDGVADALRFHAERPVQIESGPASLLEQLGGSRIDVSFRSHGLVGGSAGAVEWLSTLALALALAAIAWLAWRRRGGGLAVPALGALLAVVALGRVLSPQYLLWIAPFLLLVPLRVATAGLAAIAATWAYYPDHYADLVAGDDTAVAVVGVRNLLLLLALGLTLLELRSAARR
jgi:uncharacterized membrane protein